MMKKCDMVRFDKCGHIEEIFVKPEMTDLEYSWVFAIWKPKFTLFMHDYLKHELAKRQKSSTQIEIHQGHVIQAAIKSGFKVVGHLFDDFDFIDIGNIGNIPQALREYFLKRA
jgi:glucose-1-phosphate thymidylyltransferase